MNLSTYYEPWSVLRSFRNELNRLGWPEAGAVENAETDGNVVSGWAPAIDVREESDRYVIRADVPGVAPKDIEITVEGNELTLKGARCEEKTQDERGCLRLERAQGSFYRRFRIPATSDPESIEAQSRDGVLEIVLRKQPTAQPRRIGVREK